MTNNIGHVLIYLCCACICFCFIIPLAFSRFCDFETKLCDWMNGSDWQRITGISQSDGGPENDHTFKNGSGFYLYLRRAATSPGHELQSITLNQPHTCLAFSYSIYGTDPLSLRVLVRNDSSIWRELWNVSGNDRHLWNVTALNFDHDGDFKFVFKVEKSGHGHVALDDISITGSCLDCSFEHGFCNNWGYDKEWKITTSKPSEYSFRNDHFLALDNSSCSDQHQFFSKLSSKPCRATLKFSYFLSGREGTYIKVFLQRNPTEVKNIFENVGNSTTIWKDTVRPISEDVEYRIVFKASLGNGCSDRVAVDDITLTYGSCLNSEHGAKNGFEVSTGIQSTTAIKTSTNATYRDSTDLQNKNKSEVSYDVYVGIAFGLVAIVVVASVVILIVIRKRRQRASHEKTTAFETHPNATHKHGDIYEQQTASNANHTPVGNVNISNESHLRVHNANNYSYAEMSDVRFVQVSNTGDENMYNTLYERQNIPRYHGKVDDVYNTTFQSPCHARDDRYDHTSHQNVYDSTNIVKKNAIVDPTYDHTAEHKTYVKTQTVKQNALVDPCMITH